jgi:hypothetical protein
MKVYLVLIFMLVTLLITNPNEASHETKAKAAIHKALKTDSTYATMALEGTTKGIARADQYKKGWEMMDKIIDDVITTDNYYLFSATKAKTEGKPNETIGYGVLGMVHILPSAIEMMNQANASR